MPRWSVTRRTSSAIVAHLALHGVDQLGLEPTDRAVGDLGRDEALHRAEHELLDVGEHARLRVGVERVAEQLRELGVERDERAGERAVVGVEQAGRGAGDLVDRVVHLRLEAALELGERALDHVDVDAHVRGPQRPRPHPEAVADRGDRVVGLGDDPHDLVVGLVELPHVDHAVGHEDPAPSLEHHRLCTHRHHSLHSVERPLAVQCARGV